MMSTSGLHAWKRFRSRPKSETYSPTEGKKLRRWRSCWMRRSMMTSASGQHGVEVVADLDAQFAEDIGHERGRADQRDARAELAQRPDIGARHAAEEDVAADDDMERFPRAIRAEALAHGEGVEQRLGGMLVRAIARVEQVGLQPLGQEARRARGGMAQDDEVGLHRLEHLAGVLERLALAEGARFAVDGDDIGAQARARPARTRCACACSARRRDSPPCDRRGACP